MKLTSREALLRLIENKDDGVAIVALWEENRVVINAAIRKWLGGKGYQAARYNVLRRITQSAKYFIAEMEDPSEWVARTADLECRGLRLGIEWASARNN